MRSLWFKLMGAFALVILVGVTADALLVSRSTSGQFSRYVTQSGQAWARSMAPAFADYYAASGSWQGAETLLRDPGPAMMGSVQAAPGGRSSGATPPNMGGMMGSGMMGSRAGSGGSMGMMGGDMWAWMGVRLLLADQRGTVVADSASTATGTTLKPADLVAGVPVQVDGRQVGTLLAVQATADVATPAGGFLSAVNRSTWLAGLVAGMLALVLGWLLFRQIVAPVRAVTTAAQHLAAGQLDEHVPVRSHDEVGQLASAFNQMADALVRDRQLRRNMIADIAHELRTPLSVIQGNLEAMLDGVLPTTPQEIASLHDETIHLTRLVTDLRLLSLAEAGQLKLERTATNLGALASKVVERMAPQAEAASIGLTADVAPELPPVNADVDRISQVIANLVSNALRYTPAGGRVTVSVGTIERQQNRQPRHASLPVADHPYLLVTVQDTGSGVAAEDLPHVFDRFYRADKSRNRASGGSGIGLAIVKQLVEAHGGQVGVESEPGHGALVWFTLPTASPSPQVVTAAPVSV